MADRSKQREFEQKVAKETKGKGVGSSRGSADESPYARLALDGLSFFPATIQLLV
jgi:hypothetical protein